jgi:hypothetical protein
MLPGDLQACLILYSAKLDRKAASSRGLAARARRRATCAALHTIALVHDLGIVEREYFVVVSVRYRWIYGLQHVKLRGRHIEGAVVVNLRRESRRRAKARRIAGGMWKEQPVHAGSDWLISPTLSARDGRRHSPYHLLISPLR